MTLQELTQQVLELPTVDRWALLKLLIELLQPSSLATSTPNTLPITSTESDTHPLAKYYGCIDDETFVKTTMKRQWSPDFLSVFGAWEGEPLVRADQEEASKREPF